MTTDTVRPAAAAGGPGPGLTPARKGLLAVGVVGSLLAIAFGTLNVIGWLARTTAVDRFDLTSSSPSLQVESNGGSVTVVPSRDSQVHVVATARYALSKPDIGHEATASGLVLSSACDGFHPFGNCSVDFDVQVPASYSLMIRSDGGRISASGLSGEVKLLTGGGEIAVSALSGPVVLDTGGGDITGDRLSGPTATAETGGGDVDLTFAGDAVTSVSAESGGGDVTVSVPTTVDYRVDASSGGGRVDTEIRSNPGSARLVHVRSGGGNVSVLPTR